MTQSVISILQLFSFTKFARNRRENVPFSNMIHCKSQIAACCVMKASFWGLFKTNFYGHFPKLFVITKFKFSKFREKVFLNCT